MREKKKIFIFNIFLKYFFSIKIFFEINDVNWKVRVKMSFFFSEIEWWSFSYFFLLKIKINYFFSLSHPFHTGPLFTNPSYGFPTFPFLLLLIHMQSQPSILQQFIQQLLLFLLHGEKRYSKTLCLFNSLNLTRHSRHRQRGDM